MENPVIIIGANHLGKATIDIFKKNGVLVYCLLDDDKSLEGNEIADVSVLGTSEDEGILSMIGDKCEYFIASDNNSEKEILSDKIIKEHKKKAVNAIHSKSIISDNAILGHGNLIDAGAILKMDSELGDCNNVNSGVVLGIGSKVGSYVQIGINSSINENVIVKDKAFIGSGVTIVGGVTIGENARIGAGSVVVSDVPAGSTFFGNPAQKV